MDITQGLFAFILLITHYTSHIHKHTVLENVDLKFYQCLSLFQIWGMQGRCQRRRPLPSTVHVLNDNVSSIAPRCRHHFLSFVTDLSPNVLSSAPPLEARRLPPVHLFLVLCIMNFGI